jgi:gas vesicle protein
MKKFFSFMTGVLMGGLVGATVALLLAPFSGDTLRGQIRERIGALQDELSEIAGTRRAELEKQLANLRQPKSTSVTLEE